MSQSMSQSMSKPILNKQEIEYFRNNQHLITQELLDALRLYGNEGKHTALEILDTPINEKKYHLDAFGQPISFDGNKSLKKPDTQLAISDIHISEIARCASDFSYFRDNYIQIKTPHGVDFPDLRPYQDRLIAAMLEDENEEIVGLIGRQCVGGDTMLDMEDRNCTIRELFEMVDNLEPFEGFTK